MKNCAHPAPAHLRSAAPSSAATTMGRPGAALRGSQFARGSSSVPPASPAVDPRLLLHAHRVPSAGTLAGSTLRGSLYPGFPGASTIQIAAPDQMTPPGTSGARFELVAVMPGMRMIPARARLQLRDGVYHG